MKKNIRIERENLCKKSMQLRALALDEDYLTALEMRKKQDKIYAKWNFYDKFIKASEKVSK